MQQRHRGLYLEVVDRNAFWHVQKSRVLPWGEQHEEAGAIEDALHPTHLSALLGGQSWRVVA